MIKKQWSIRVPTHVVGSETSYAVLSGKTHYRFYLLEQEVIIVYLKY